MDSSIQFLYSTMLPAVVLVPWWFHTGRYWLLLWMGDLDDDLVDLLTGDGDNGFWHLSQVCRRALPGMMGFHLLLWWWERPRVAANHHVLEVALGLWAVYFLQLAYQVFYVTTISTCDDKNSGNDSTTAPSSSDDHCVAWSICVATKWWGFPTKIADRISQGLAMDLWIIMGVTLFVSYWHHPALVGRIRARTILSLIRYRMTHTLWPSVYLAPLWSVGGHLFLGSGGFGKTTATATSNIEVLLWQSLGIVLPFHALLWQKEKHKRYLSTPMSFGLLAYYGVQGFCQLFVIPDNGFLQHALNVPAGFSVQVASACKITLVILMLFLLALSLYEEEEPVDDNDDNGESNNNNNNNSAEEGDGAAAAATTNTDDAVDSLPRSREDELRMPLLAAASHPGYSQGEAEPANDDQVSSSLPDP